MTISELIENLRSALLALIPSVNRVEIPWRRPHAYDEWDSLVSVVYCNLVSEVLRWGVPEHLRDDFKLPPYDLLISDYMTDQLTHVCTNADGTTCGQPRQLVHDGPGFLTQETNPEIGPTGGGSINFTRDARGNALTKDVVGAGEFDLLFTYDKAGRPRIVERASSYRPSGTTGWTSSDRCR